MMIEILRQAVVQWDLAFGAPPAEIVMHPWLFQLLTSECDIVVDKRREAAAEIIPHEPATFGDIPIRLDQEAPLDRIYLAQRVDVKPPEVIF